MMVTHQELPTPMATAQIEHQQMPMLNLGVNKHINKQQPSSSSTTTTTTIHDAHPLLPHHCHH